MTALPNQSAITHSASNDYPFFELRHKSRQFKIVNISYAGMLCAWIFDFRSEGAGQGLAFQVIFMTIYIFSFISFVLSARYSRVILIFPFLIFSFNFMVVGVFSGLFLDQEFYGIFRNSFSVFIYISSTFSSYVFVRMMRSDLSSLRQIISVLSVAYLASTLFIVYFFQGGIDASKVRYEIIGTSVVISLTYVSIFLRFKLRNIEILAALIVVSIVALSVTRTWIVVFAAQFFLVLFLGGGFGRETLRRAVLPGVFVAFSLITLQISGAPIIDRWTERLFASDRVGIDPTTLTRQRQVESMVDAIKIRPFFGNGLYAQSSYWLEKQLGGGDGDVSGNGFGHNQDVSIIFIAGFVGGSPLLIWQYCIGLNSVWFIYNLRRFGDRNDKAMLGITCSLCIVGTLVYGQFGGTFGSRGMTLWYGVATGLMLGLRSLFPTPLRTGATKAL